MPFSRVTHSGLAKLITSSTRLTFAVRVGDLSGLANMTSMPVQCFSRLADLKQCDLRHCHPVFRADVAGLQVALADILESDIHATHMHARMHAR